MEIPTPERNGFLLKSALVMMMLVVIGPSIDFGFFEGVRFAAAPPSPHKIGVSVRLYVIMRHYYRQLGPPLSLIWSGYPQI